MIKNKKIISYQIRRNDNDGIRQFCPSLQEAKNACSYGCSVWSVYRKTYGIRLRIFWMSPFRKVGYDKYSKVVNFFHLHVGWDLMKRDVALEKVYEPKDNPM